MKEIAKETLTVMIGILLALLINNWNDDRKERKYLEQIYSSIQMELQEGVDNINTIIPEQLASDDTIQAYLNNDQFSIYDLLIKSNGIHGPNIKTNSWQALSNSKIELIEYERLSALADIEARSTNLTQRLEKQVDFIYRNFEDRSSAKKKILRMMILDIVGAEKSVQSEMQALINNYPSKSIEAND